MKENTTTAAGKDQLRKLATLIKARDMAAGRADKNGHYVCKPGDMLYDEGHAYEILDREHIRELLNGINGHHEACWQTLDVPVFVYDEEDLLSVVLRIVIMGYAAGVRDGSSGDGGEQ